MNYPLISEYIQSIKFSSENFDKLNNLRPVLDANSNPIMSSGNFAVVFKMEDIQSGKLYAVKCFLREQEGRDESYRLIASELEYVSSTYLTPIQYLEKELFVDTKQGNDTEFPVLLMDWVEGLTLDKYIRNNIHDKYKLSLIAYQFCRMGSWLLSQEFAHGDLKPDNIIVREDGQLVLVDYDGMFVPAMRGQKSRELGSVDYRHPLRTEDVFNGNIDDFSIASIALSLKAISLKPELLNEFGAEDRLLFSTKDYQNIGENECLKAIQSLADDNELSQLLGLFYIVYARNELTNVSFELFNITKPEYVPMAIPEVQLSTAVTDEDLENSVEDEYGVKYSKDGVRLLKAPKAIERYKVKEGVRVICSFAFRMCTYLEQIYFPNSILHIGLGAFMQCSSLKEVIIPNSVIKIGDYVFFKCSSLRYIVLSDSMINISCGAFYRCSSLKYIFLPKSIRIIGDLSFLGCSFLKKVTIPNSVEYIGKDVFKDCYCNNFYQVKSVLEAIIVPHGQIIKFKELLKDAGCDLSIIKEDLANVVEDEFGVAYSRDGLSLLKASENIKKCRIEDGTAHICDWAFRGCSLLYEVIIPSSVRCIDFYAFGGCSSLREVFINSSMLSIKEGIFKDCKSLQSIFVPKGKTAKFRELLKNAGCDLSIIKEQDE